MNFLSSAKEKSIRIGNELTLFNLALIDLKESEAYKPTCFGNYWHEWQNNGHIVNGKISCLCKYDCGSSWQYWPQFAGYFK